MSNILLLAQNGAATYEETVRRAQAYEMMGYIGIGVVVLVVLAMIGNMIWESKKKRKAAKLANDPS